MSESNGQLRIRRVWAMPNHSTLSVQPVYLKEIREWLERKHYAHCVPSVSYAFGLFTNNLIGVVTYGTPPSWPLKRGICGSEYAARVLELNRLVVNDDAPRNAASRLVGQSLRLLPRPSIVVSFADTAQGHIGYIYQATNFLYTGLSAKRTNWKIRGMESKHSISIADISRGQKDRAAFMRERYGDDFYLEPRPRKHRYVYFVGNRQERMRMQAALRYPVQPYPKGESHRYDASYQPKAKGLFQ